MLLARLDESGVVHLLILAVVLTAGLSISTARNLTIGYIWLAGRERILAAKLVGHDVVRQPG
jgi:hypothetical protein